MNAKKKLSKDSSSEISSLFKLMLIMVEDMKKDHDFHYQKLYNEIPTGAKLVKEDIDSEAFERWSLRAKEKWNK